MKPDLGIKAGELKRYRRYTSVLSSCINGIFWMLDWDGQPSF